jgi:hypothetical protein
MSQRQKNKESLTIARAALEADSSEAVQGSNRLNDNLAKAGKKIWRQVLVIWAVGIVLVISYFLALNHEPITTDQTQKSSVDQQEAGANPETAKSSESSQPSLNVIHVSPAIPAQEDLITVLNQIREAQLKKDIQLFMKAYSLDFPDLTQKREMTLNIWKRYSYLDSQFKLTDLQQENSSTTFGKVTWNIKVQDQKTATTRIITKSYYVTFSNQSGKWLIKNLKAIDIKSN